MWPFKSDDPTAEFSDDEVQTAALRLFRGRYPHVSGSWIGGTLSQCDWAQKRVDELRAEFTNVAPPRMHRAVMNWCDHFDREIVEARSDIQSQKSKREMDEYRAKNAAHDARVRALIEKL